MPEVTEYQRVRVRRRSLPPEPVVNVSFSGRHKKLLHAGALLFAVALAWMVGRACVQGGSLGIGTIAPGVHIAAGVVTVTNTDSRPWSSVELILPDGHAPRWIGSLAPGEARGMELAAANGDVPASPLCVVKCQPAQGWLPGYWCGLPD